MREIINFYFMHIQVLFILSLVILLFNTTSATSHSHESVAAAAGQAVHKCIEKERQALLDFKAPLHDPEDRLSTWRHEEEEDDCCQWSGVGCNNQTGHVTKLDLSMYHLGGEISLSLLNLTYLNHLDIVSNSFHGTIPKFICSLTHLTFLSLAYNEFTGTIPESIGNMTQLTHLYLNWNNFNGTIPIAIGSLTSLTFFDLSHNEFRGVVPESIGYLTKLTLLDLSSNQFSGTIPMSIGSLTKLTDLYLPSNRFSGTIPMSIGSLTKLKYLDLAGNNFSGFIPRSIGSLTKLTSLKLSDNSFYGTIPSEFGNLTNLDVLYLESLENCRVKNLDWLSSLSSLGVLKMDGTSLAKANNWVNAIIGLQNLNYLSLVGCDLSHVMHPYSSSVNSSSSIIVLYLQKNNLKSPMYSSLCPLFGKKLRFLYVTGNTFDGNLSDFLNSLSTSATTLETLDASSNHFTGSLDEIQNFSFLKRLYLSFNHLSGTISQKIWNRWKSSQLSYLDLSFNNISGTLPKSLSNHDLDYIDLNSNCFYGPIPDFPARISFLDLSRNKFHGGFSFLCQLYEYLEFLDISRNRITGQLPDCFRNLTNLEVLNLGHDILSGKIPPVNRILETLSLYNNSFSGELPLNLKNCTNLSLLDLGANILYGNIPFWIGKNMSRLYALSLKSNNLFGTIPSQICQLESLQILDLSFNNLHGTIPLCVNNLTSMIQKGSFLGQNQHQMSWYINITGNSDFVDNTYIDHMLIEWQGNVNEFSSNLGLLKVIDLSSNKLTGKIPNEVTNLHGLLVLDLSNNSLVGEIPRNIGHMTKLLTLNLSRNMFSGEIPPTMSDMTLLNNLDLSFNNLSGRIPLGTQLQTFNASIYIGNAGLCGLPLPNKCSGDEDLGVPPVSESGGDGKNTDELERWLYIGGVTGFATAFWIACSALLFNRRLRHAFFHFHNCLKDWMYVKVAVWIAKFQRAARA